MTDSTDDLDRENIRTRLLKVLRLAQQGVGGERENAEVLLAKLLRKHGMTMADLEGASDQPRATVWMPAGDLDERTVLSQLVIKLFGTSRKVFGRQGDTNLAVEVTPSEHAALTIAWEVYRAAFAEARQALVMGFCFKHGLYATEPAAAPEATPESRERAQRAIALADALPRVESPTRRIGGDGQPLPPQD